MGLAPFNGEKPNRDYTLKCDSQVYNITGTAQFNLKKRIYDYFNVNNVFSAEMVQCRKLK